MKIRLILAVVVISFLGCTDSQKPTVSSENATEEMEQESSAMNKEFDLQGHRGARGLFPENSIEGFVAAVELQVNTLEMDVVISKDRQVVVSHEPWISSVICWGLDDRPVKEGKGLNMFEMDYAEISNYNCGSQPHPDFPLQAKMSTFKPLLAEVVSEVESAVAALELDPVKYNIEIKSTPEGDGIYHPSPDEFAQLVYDEIVAFEIVDRSVIQAFDVRALQAMKQIDSSIPVALLIYETQGFEKDLERLGFTPEIYSPYFKLVDKDLVTNCHQNGIQLIPWTVNEEDEMIEMLELGVDGLITDYPDIALTLKL